MKTKLLYLLFFFTAIAFSQNVNIPDATFKFELVSNSAINTNNDSEIQVTEANAYTGIINVANQSISDLTGIEAFTDITGLICSNTNISNLDVSANTNLQELDCSDNDLMSLNIANGNNVNFLSMNAETNPNLTCIQVDSDWELITFEDVSLTDITAEDANLSNSTLVIVQNDVHIIGVNEVIVYKTSNGFYGKFEILQIDKVAGKYILTMRAVTYNQDGTVLTQTTNQGITIREGFLCELDPSILEIPSMSTNGDFRWSQISAVDVNLLPVNTAVFMPYEINSNKWSKDVIAAYSNDCSALSIEDATFSNAVNIYPNPVTNQLHISSTNHTEIKEIEVYNILSKKVLATNSTILNVSGLANGIYFLKMKSKGGLIATKKFVKK